MKLIPEFLSGLLGRRQTFEATESWSSDPEYTFVSTARADEITARVRPEEFKRGTNCHVLVTPSGEMRLNRPKITNGAEVEYRIEEPIGVPRPLLDFPAVSYFPNLTISRLTEAVCVQGGVAISQDNRIIAETFTCYWDTRFHNSLEKNSAGYRFKSPPGPITRLPGKYLFMDFQHLAHYGHAIADVLPRMWSYHYLRDIIGISGVKLLVTSTGKNFVGDLLVSAGIDRADILEISAPVVVDELFVATKAMQLQDYVAPISRQIWDNIALRAERNPTSPHRVYLSRSKHPQRVLLNEHAVEDVFRAHDFQIVHPEMLPFAEQLSLAVGADLVAGPSGSNLFTLAFQQKMRSAFIMTSPSLIHITDSLLQAGKNCDLRMYIGKIATDSPIYRERWLHNPWTIDDLDDLRCAVDKWVRDLS